MNHDTARQLASAVASILKDGRVNSHVSQTGPHGTVLSRVKAIHVSQTGTGGRVRIDCFLVPLASKDLQDPEPNIFLAEEL